MDMHVSVWQLSANHTALLATCMWCCI